MEKSQQVGRIFDEWARQGKAEGMEERHAPTARRAFEWLAMNGGERYLDIGCGNGYSVRWAAAIDGVTAVGVDVSREMIDRARAASVDRANVSFHCDVFPSVALEPASFDAIFSMEVFYYLDDLHRGLAAARRLLRPGGRFACAVDLYLEHEESHRWSDDLGVALHLLSMEEWRDAMSRAGFDAVEQERLEPTLVTYGRAL